ncbi:b- and t-lymphocyte attenuator [Limosa lapponica baueri]|uniref:B-and t-lymphocyte attenuator n=1 Tax=Limosa lapponica baueri TaxID=1758121 RepID=A0A2I0U370_LIMLA|nr:b- and t-lymphocyte attenuator [Limosa lapponica baueri]
MKAPLVMMMQRILLYLLLVMLAQSNYQVYGLNATDCPGNIQVHRQSRYKVNVGNSLIIHCSVHYCKKKRVMQQCKMEEATCVQLKEGKTERKINVFTLEVISVHQKDSGCYRCQTVGTNLLSVSHGIEATVEEKPANIITVSPENTTNVSEGSQGSGNYKILHIIYASAFVGLCCPFIVVCMFWCLRRHHGAQATTRYAQSCILFSFLQVRSPAAAPSHAAGTTQASEESSSLYYCSMASPLQALNSNRICDNDIPPWNPQRTAPNEPRNDPVIPSIPVVLESPDVLTYATLNHSASAERCQRRVLTVENEFTEYASINVPLCPALQPVQVMLDSSTALWSVSQPSQFGIISELAEDTLCPLIQVIDEYVEQDWAEY